MLAYLSAGAALLAVLLVAGRWLAGVSTNDLAQAARTFVAVFSALAGSGLILLGRYGLAAVTLAAAGMALRSLIRGRRGADPLEGGAGAAGSARVETELLVMELDRASGRLDGRVRTGPLAGRSLDGLDRAELLGLLATARRDDPPSVALLEAYLDRREPGWRAAGTNSGGGPAAGTAAMDERTARAILGVGPEADAEAIRAAHRRLMARLHPDHGGSTFLAAQINAAKELLLGRPGGSGRC
jgi:hypothetical protein